MANNTPKENHPDEPIASIDAAKAAAQEMLYTYLYISSKHSQPGFDYTVMNGLRLVTASSDPLNHHKHPWTLWEIDITKAYTNVNNVVHGGAVGWIFDVTTSTALCPVQKPGFWDFIGGVTRTLNISYVKAVPSGTTVRVRSWVVQYGRTMAMIRGQMESVSGETVYATVEHHKVNVPISAQHLTLRQEMREAKNAMRKETSKL